MMKCSDCCDGGADRPRACAACRKMQTEGTWEWELDNGNRQIRCPDCGGGMIFGAWRYENPYNFCPYCGKRRITHEQLTLLEE